ncbi:UNVERIFIED_CONTAM: type IV pili twitching motility protein PilT, partial [Salmonella enterica subsp. enterica serovar Weltevreden]
LNSPLIADHIFKGNVGELKDVMKRSRELGMQTFDQSLYGLYKAGTIELDEALENADSRTNLEAKINFGG